MASFLSNESIGTNFLYGGTSLDIIDTLVNGGYYNKTESDARYMSVNSSNVVINGSLHVKGDVVFDGSVNAVNLNTMNVDSGIITTGLNNHTDTNPIGLVGEYKNASNTLYAGIVRNPTSKNWCVASGLSSVPTSDISNSHYDNFNCNDLSSNTIHTTSLNTTNLTTTNLSIPSFTSTNLIATNLSNTGTCSFYGTTLNDNTTCRAQFDTNSLIVDTAAYIGSTLNVGGNKFTVDVNGNVHCGYITSSVGLNAPGGVITTDSITATTNIITNALTSTFAGISTGNITTLNANVINATTINATLTGAIVSTVNSSTNQKTITNTSNQYALGITNNNLGHSCRIVANDVANIAVDSGSLVNDFGLYNQGAGRWMRFVSNGGNFNWWSNYTSGTTLSTGQIMSLDYAGNLSITGQLNSAYANITGLLTTTQLRATTFTPTYTNLNNNGYIDSNANASLQTLKISAPDAYTPALVINPNNATNSMIVMSGNNPSNSVLPSSGAITNDACLVSTSSGNYMRFITNNGDFHWYSNFANGTSGTGSDIAHLTNNGLFYCNGGSLASDIRLKHNISDCSYGLDAINQIDIKNYNYISDDSNTPQIGVIAQDLEKIIPECIQIRSNEYEDQRYVNYNALFSIAINAIKDLSKEVNTLKQQINVLNTRFGIVD